MGENYYEAAIRHFVDGSILENEECYDNAVYLFGYAAECALKSLISVYCGQNSSEFLKQAYSHSGSNLLNDLYTFVVNDSMAPVLDPSLGVKLQSFVLPEVLFRNHPERRYWSNGQFEEVDADNCRNVVGFLINEMAGQHIDGYI